MNSSITTAGNAVSSRALNQEQHQWVEKTLSGFSLDQLIGQVLCPITISWDASLDPRELARTAIKHHVGSVFYASGSRDTMRAVSSRLYNEMATVPMVCADFELGAMGVSEGTRFGDALALGAIEDEAKAEAIAYECGRTAAVEGRAAGLNWALGPVVDIPYHHEASLANIRCFSGRIERIRALSSAYLCGLQDHGMGATLKHFPGDGVDDRDQHITTSVNPFDLKRWNETYGQTFRGGIEAGVYSIMIGHIALPSLGGRNPRTGLPLPATLDRGIIQGLLRDELGFDGLVVSDALGMVGILGHCRDKIEATVRSLAAGCDVGLFAYRLEETVAAIKDALQGGSLSEGQLGQSARRVLEMKAKLGLHHGFQLPDAESAAAAYHQPQSLKAARSLAEASITLVRNFDNAFPLRLEAGKKIVVCNLPVEPVDPSAIPPPGEVMKDEDCPHLVMLLRERGYDTVCVRERQGLEQALEGADALIYIFNSRPGGSMGHLRLSKAALCCLKWELLNGDLPTLCISLGSPYVAWELASLPNLACGYSPTNNIQEALCSAMLGDIPFRGKLPVKIPQYCEAPQPV